MSIRFHTNLDQPQHQVGELPSTWYGPPPPVGSEIEFREPFAFSLRVVAVRFDVCGNARVELHLPTHHRCVRDWEEWWKRRRQEAP